MPARSSSPSFRDHEPLLEQGGKTGEEECEEEQCARRRSAAATCDSMATAALQRSRMALGKTVVRLLLLLAAVIGLLALVSTSSSAHEAATRLLASPQQQQQRFSMFEDLAAPQRPTTMMEQLRAHRVPVKQAKIIKLVMAYGKGAIDPKGVALGMDDVRSRSVALHVEHARRHGYRQYMQTVDVMGNIMTKVATTLHVMSEELQRPVEERAEWVVMHDVDMVCFNLAMPLETFLPPSDRTDINMLATWDGNGFNSGAVFLRVSRWSLEMLSGNVFYQYAPGARAWNFAEQGMMGNIAADIAYFNQSSVIVPKHWINAYPPGWEVGFEPGHWILHTVAHAKEHLPTYVAEAELRLPKYNVPPEQSGLAEEAHKFWRSNPRHPSSNL